MSKLWCNFQFVTKTKQNKGTRCGLGLGGKNQEVVKSIHDICYL